MKYGMGMTNGEIYALITKIFNTEKWITVKPNGENNKGRHLKLKDGETPKQAMKRAWGVDVDKKAEAKKKQAEKPKEEKKEDGFTVERETKKAKLLRKGDKSFWIQKRWQREDGTLTKAGQKAYEEAKTDTQKQEEKQKAKEEREKGVKAIGKPDWESDKALGYDLSLKFPHTERRVRHRIFVPKSIIQENGNIPTWFIEKKTKEMIEEYTYRNGDFWIENHPFEGSLGFYDLKDLSESDDKIKTNNSESKKIIYTIVNNTLSVSIDNGYLFKEVKDDI